MTYALGKPIRPEVVEVEDEWESFTSSHGTRMQRNKRTRAIRTDEQPKGPQYPDPYQHMLDILRKQEEDGFCLTEWGVL